MENEEFSFVISEDLKIWNKAVMQLLLKEWYFSWKACLKATKAQGCRYLRVLFIKNPLKHAVVNNAGSYFGNDFCMNYQVGLMAKPGQWQALIPDFSGKCTENKEACTVFSKGDFSGSPGLPGSASASMAGQNSWRTKVRVESNDHKQGGNLQSYIMFCNTLWTDLFIIFFIFLNLRVGNSQRIISCDTKCVHVCVFPHFGPSVVPYGAKLLPESTLEEL